MKPSNLEKYQYEGDDSSDEEVEASIYSRTLEARNYDLPETGLPGIKLLKREAQDLDLKWSLILQDFGMRLLISDSVRSLYFPYKSKLGEFDKLPNDENIRAALQNAITKSLKKYPNSVDAVLESKDYNELLEELLANKRKIFSLSKDVNITSSLLTTIKAEVLAQPVSITLEEIFSRRVDGAVQEVKKACPAFLTPTKKISKSTQVSTTISSLTSSSESKTRGVDVMKILKKVHDTSPPRTTTEDAFKERVKKMVLDEIEEQTEEILGLDWLDSEVERRLDREIQNLKSALERPTLADATSFSPKDISTEARYSIPEKLFCYLRLIHCSAKRFIKNAETIKDFDGKDFDGAAFSRGWQFDDESPLVAIEMQFISSGKTLKSKVQYPYKKSDYNSLRDKLESFQSKMDISHGKLVECIREILKEGKILDTTLYENPYFKTFERFLNVFTFHLFGTEVQRHPAAIIHNIMALDLVESQEDWGFIARLPMAIKKVLPVVRAMQLELNTKLLLPYYYDASRDNLSGLQDDEFQEFVIREEALVLEWLKSKKLATKITAGFIEQINILCKKYYGISLISDKPIKELLNKAFSSHSDENEDIIIPHGFSDVPGDGLCFYHAIAHQLNNNYTAHDLQNMAIDHILKNPAYYKEFINGLGIPGITDQMTSLEAIETYINYHLGSNSWADHLMIQALANALGMSINVHMFNVDGTTQVHEDAEHEGEEVIISFPPQAPAIGTLIVGNISNLHFVTQEVIIAEPEAKLQLEIEENIPALSNGSIDSSELIGLASALSWLNIKDIDS